MTSLSCLPTRSIMPYRLRKSEAVPTGITRVLGEEIRWATGQLTNSQNPEEAIHEARKSVKKIRGLLRLLQPELGKVYRAENRRFRAIGGHLSEIRDAAAVIETFDAIVAKHPDSPAETSFKNIRLALERSKREVEQSLDMGKTIAGARADLNAAPKNWPLHASGFEALSPGLAAGYRRGRKALSAAEKSPRPEVFHEFRKSVKEHWYHLRLLEGLWSPELKDRAKQLKRLEAFLGEEHNLTVLREKLEKQPETYADREEVKCFLALADIEDQSLRGKSLALGKRLYSEKPRQFVAAVAVLWETWQVPPVRKAPAKAKSKATAKRQAAVA